MPEVVPDRGFTVVFGFAFSDFRHTPALLITSEAWCALACLFVFLRLLFPLISVDSRFCRKYVSRSVFLAYFHILCPDLSILDLTFPALFSRCTR